MSIVALIAALYVLAGVVFCVTFLFAGVASLDGGAGGSGRWFRVLLIPGTVLLWPLLAWKWALTGGGRSFAADAEEFRSARSLRGTHGLWVHGIAVAVPLLAGAVLLNRVELPRPGGGEVSAVVDRVEVQLGTRGGGRVEPCRSEDSTPAPFAELPVTFGLCPANGAQRRVVRVDVEADLQQPAVFLYWTDSVSGAPRTADAVLLGSIWGPATHAFELPEQQRRSAGRLFMYSLGHAEVVGVAPVQG